MAVEVVWLSGGPLCPVVLVLCFFCTPSPSWPLTPDWSFLSADFSRLSRVLKSCCILCPDTFTRFLRACTSRACVECSVRYSVCVCVCVCVCVFLTWDTPLLRLLWPEVGMTCAVVVLSWSVVVSCWPGVLSWSVTVSCWPGVLSCSYTVEAEHSITSD